MTRSKKVKAMPQTSIRDAKEQIKQAHSDEGLDYIRDNPNRAPGS